MNYESKTGFGRVRWPRWHDAVVVLAVIFLILVLTASSCETDETGDRKTDQGKRADGIEDVTNVTVYRNIDSYPNQEIFCIENYAYRSTSHMDTRGADVDRAQEFDANCPGGE